MSMNKQGFDRAYAGQNKDNKYVPHETGKSNSRKFRKREEAKARQKARNSRDTFTEPSKRPGVSSKKERVETRQRLRDEV